MFTLPCGALSSCLAYRDEIAFKRSWLKHSLMLVNEQVKQRRDNILHHIETKNHDASYNSCNEQQHHQPFDSIKRE